VTTAEERAVGPGTDLLTTAWTQRPGLLGWLGVVNHKQVGVRFLVTGAAFFLLGGIEALLIRWQLSRSESTFLTDDAYNAVFTLHGTTMMFLFAVPVAEALAIYFLPLMLGTRDLPMPRLSAFTYWTYLAGGLLLYASLIPGTPPTGGWYAYVPLTGPVYSPGAGLDFWLLGVTLIEISGTIGAIEIIICFLRCRAPGMSLARIPVFAWGSLVTAGMILLAFPPLIAASILLELDRKLGTPFYDAARGGDPVLWQHLFWFFGHPEVYIMLLPALGIVSLVIPVLARARLVGYTLVVASTVAIGVLSFGLWVHHMYAVGIPFLALALFAIGSFVIAIPSGVQIFAWIATLWQGRVEWRTPMLYAVGFIVIFVMGGVTGVMVAAAPYDLQAHDTYFVVAHFHYVIVGGMLFPLFAGLYFWWPKVTGRMLSERLGTIAFWVLILSFNLAFMPQHIVGMLGMPRRIYTYAGYFEWDVYNLLSTVGAFGFAFGVLLTLVNVAWSWRRGPVAGPDPWGGNTLEWATSSPPEQFNFRHIPVVADRDPLWFPPPEQPEPEWMRRLAQPDRLERRLVLTRPLDGEPDQVVTIPQHSLLPLGATVALVVLLVGILVDSLTGTLIGAVLAALAALAVAATRQDQP
jgi:cytochrome c oxidase subunit I+III